MKLYIHSYLHKASVEKMRKLDKNWQGSVDNVGVNAEGTCDNVGAGSQGVFDILRSQYPRASQGPLGPCVNCGLVLSALKEQMISKRAIKRGNFHSLVTLIR